MGKVIHSSRPEKFTPKQSSISSKNINKTFGRPEDHIDIAIYDLRDNLLLYESSISQYTYQSKNTPPSTTSFPTNVEPEVINENIEGAGQRDYNTLGPNQATEGYWFNTGAEKIWVSTLPMETQDAGGRLTPEISVNPVEILESKGYKNGKYRIKFYIKRDKVFNTTGNPFAIKEVSSNRKEIRTVTPQVPNNTLNAAVSAFISEIEGSVYFKDFYLSFGEDINFLAINILLNKNSSKYETLFKTLDPLPSFVTEETNFKICEYIIDPIVYTIDLGNPIIEENVIPLRGPNTNIDVRLQNSIPSKLKNYNQLLEYSSTSSYNRLLNKLENSIIPQVDYDYIRPISQSWDGTEEESYHFENFIHFGSAQSRLKNFEYKLNLLETYASQSGNVNNIPTGNNDVYIKNDKGNLEAKRQKVIKGFDGYEQFLYYTTGSNIYTWPKSSKTKPYTLHSVTSSTAKTWLGTETDTLGDYGGQLLSASLFDRKNNNALKQFIPNHIILNEDNDFYVNFVNMVGQHFDKIWLHIKHLTEINDTHHVRGVSKDLVYFTLKSLGLETFDQFENANLIEYILGEGTQDHSVGSLQVGQYIVGQSNNFYNYGDHQTLVTASNDGSIPKGEITREIWKRLYHNAPYLLKTKGTERGVRALINCYGMPSTMLNIKEYGGPTKDKTTYKTFSYDKSSLALKGDSGTGGYFIKKHWSSSLTENLSTSINSSAKTVEFRIKPVRSDNNYHLFNLGSDASVDDPNDNNKQSEPILTLTPYGGNDISSSGDSTQYGKLDLYLDGHISASTANFPVYNGDFWNIFIGTPGTSGSASEIQFGAYQTNWLKNTTYHRASVEMRSEYSRSLSWGDHHSSSLTDGSQNKGGANFAYIGGTEANTHAVYDNVDSLRYSGSIQEVRFHFGEMLSHDTLVKHSLEPFMYSGNTISSSYDTVVSRLPLGSNLYKNSSSFHPRVEDRNYLPGVSSSMVDGTLEWEEIDEVHHLPTPDTGIATTSEKVRIDTGSIDDDILSHAVRCETSILDRVPQDFEDLGIFFSPTNELNEDILYTLGSFRLDDYIGSPLPTAQSASLYKDLKIIKDIYFKKVNGKYNVWDYIKLIEQVDHTLFKLVEQWVPFKANTKTGLLIEPHYLERAKVPRTVPTKTDGQTMVPGSYTTIEAEFSTFTSSQADKFEGSKLFRISYDVGGGNVTTTMNFKQHATSSQYHGKPSYVVKDKTLQTGGTNGDIPIKDLYKFEKEHAQAPIIPNSTGSRQLKRISNTSLGNIQKGKISRRYYRSLAVGNQNDFLFN
tara:strand:- start:2675 stop:6532 length:3858 start_codon:yes stop_codon:yes gene_type:complete